MLINMLIVYLEVLPYIFSVIYTDIINTLVNLWKLLQCLLYTYLLYLKYIHTKKFLTFLWNATDVSWLVVKKIFFNIYFAVKSSKLRTYLNEIFSYNVTQVWSYMNVWLRNLGIK